MERNQHSILVVDDSMAARYAVARGLRSHGYTTVEAASGAEALELARFASAVILDVNLPDVHGFEVCRILRAQKETRRVPIINISSQTDEGSNSTEADSAGADAYLPAPVDTEALVDLLDRLLLVQATDPGERSGAGSQSIVDQMTEREVLQKPGQTAQGQAASAKPGER